EVIRLEARSFRCDVADGEHARGRAGLAETLVVRSNIVDEVLCRPHDDLAAGVACSFAATCDREHGGTRELVDGVAALRLARRAHAAVRNVELDDAGHVRAAEERGGFRRYLPRLGVERLLAAEDKIDVAFL